MDGKPSIMSDKSGIQMDLREAKALEIAARCRLAFDGIAWTVPSQSGNGAYRVVLSPLGNTCSCDDFALRGQDCKHVLACRLAAERDGNGAGPVIDTDVLPQKKKYAQNWPAYDLAQATEKRRVRVL